MLPLFLANRQAMIERFEFKENGEKEFALLEYVDTISRRYTHHYADCNGEKITVKEGPTFTNPEDIAKFVKSNLLELSFKITNLTKDFVKRYNNKSLTHYFTYQKYIENTDIQKLIKFFELDRNKFWFLLLFIYDYSESLCINGYNVAPCANEQLYKMSQAILQIVKEFDEHTGATLNKETKITLSIKGEKSIVIDNPTALHLLAETIDHRLDDMDLTETYRMNYCKRLPDSKPMSDSPHIFYFAQMFLQLFNKQKSIVDKRKKGAKHSVKELELVSRLVYFTKLSTNKKLLDIESQTLKAYLKQYKTLNLSLRRSNIYTSFWI